MYFVWPPLFVVQKCVLPSKRIKSKKYKWVFRNKKIIFFFSPWFSIPKSLTETTKMTADFINYIYNVAIFSITTIHIVLSWATSFTSLKAKVNDQCLSGAIPSRKCFIKAPAKWRHSLYVLTEICHKLSKWLVPI